MAMTTMRVPAVSDCAAAASLASTSATSSSPCRINASPRTMSDTSCRDWSSVAVFSPGMIPARHTKRTCSTSKQECWQLPATAVVAAHRRAKISVKKQERVPLVTLTDPSGVPQHLSSFLQQPAGTQSMLNTKALHRYEYVGDDVYRCYLPKVTLLNFEVAPIVDLFVAASDVDCRVEMRQCVFSGSKAVEDQNERFSASLKNHLTWHDTPEGDQMLHLDTELRVQLELLQRRKGTCPFNASPVVYTIPFTMLPLSAVEVPGNAIMQAMLDRLIPLFLDYLFVDYKKWVDEDALGLGTNVIPLTRTLGPTSATSSSDNSNSAMPDCRPVEISS